MVKLQELLRTNGSTVHFVYLPEELVHDLGWVKGQELECSSSSASIIVRRSL